MYTLHFPACVFLGHCKEYIRYHLSFVSALNLIVDVHIFYLLVPYLFHTLFLVVFNPLRFFEQKNH